MRRSSGQEDKEPGSSSLRHTRANICFYSSLLSILLCLFLLRTVSSIVRYDGDVTSTASGVSRVDQTAPITISHVPGLYMVKTNAKDDIASANLYQVILNRTHSHQPTHTDYSLEIVAFT